MIDIIKNNTEPSQDISFASTLFDMYGRRLERKGTDFVLLPNDKTYWGKTVIIKENICGSDWYDFVNLDQAENYIKIGLLGCGSDRKAINQALKIDPRLKKNALTFMSREKWLEYNQKYADELQRQQEKRNGVVS